MAKKKAKTIKTDIAVNMTKIETPAYYYVERDGYSATFVDEAQKKLVAHLLSKVDGYSTMIQTLSKAINLIKTKK